MSTNITSTSDRVASDTPTSSSSSASSSALPSVQEGARKYDGVSGAMSPVPDPAMIARLANEFFAALPGAAMPADAAVPGAVPLAAAPDDPRAMFSIPALPNAQS